MTAKPTYEELEQLANALTQEVVICSNIQRYLHQAEETARALLNATTDSAILIDTQGIILAINENAAKRLAQPHVNLVRKNLYDILPPVLNDNYGHLTGDKVLAKTGEVIRKALRETDSGYRYGGEEFAVILPETDGPGAVRVAERIRLELEATPFPLNPGTSRSISASFGVSQLLANEKLSEFIKRADENLYVAKAKGKNQVIFI